MTEKKGLPTIQGFPHNYEGFPEYEEKLEQPCFYTGFPCQKAKCPKWMEVKIGMPNPLATAQLDVYTLHQCREDFLDNSLAQLNMAINKIASVIMTAPTMHKPPKAIDFGLGGNG